MKSLDTLFYLLTLGKSGAVEREEFMPSMCNAIKHLEIQPILRKKDKLSIKQCLKIMIIKKI